MTGNKVSTNAGLTIKWTVVLIASKVVLIASKLVLTLKTLKCVAGLDLKTVLSSGCTDLPHATN